MTTPTEREALLSALRTLRPSPAECDLAADMLAADARENQILRAEVELYRNGCDKREASIARLQAELNRLKQQERNLCPRRGDHTCTPPEPDDANSITAQTEREACAQECMKEMEFMTGVAQKHPEDSPARDRMHAAARSALRCADRIRSRAGFQ